MRRLVQSLASDRRGATIVEFALILPTLLVTLMGLLDMAHNMYTSQILNGAIQQAARKSTIEGASRNAGGVDAAVTRSVLGVAPGAKVRFSRSAYRNFGDIGRPEDWSDLDGNGSCNNGEPFEDANANGGWDRSAGTAGFGGARDAVLYTVTVDYPRLFPIARLIPGQSSNVQMQSTTVLRNQPFGVAGKTQPKTGNCA